MATKTVLIPREVLAQLGDVLQAMADEAGQPLRFLSDAQLERAGAVQEVAAAFFTRDVYQGSTRSTLSERAQRFFEVLLDSQRLEWLHVFSSGADRSQYKLLQAAGARITTSAGANAQSVATLALAGMLALNKKLLSHWRNQQQRHWPIPVPDEFPRSMQGQCALIVGTGHIGCQIALYLRMLGVRTVGINRSGRAAENFDQTLPIGDLLTQARHADWLVVCCPLNEATRHLIDARVLAALPAHAFLINVGRAAIVDQAALLDCLQARRIGGAHLDVFEPEPLPADSPFWQLDNVMMTPHAGAQSTGIEDRVNEIFVENFRRWLQQEPLLNLLPS
jgi:D-2-hydroxyacid dehydrogenase (NADP+)